MLLVARVAVAVVCHIMSTTEALMAAGMHKAKPHSWPTKTGTAYLQFKMLSSDSSYDHFACSSMHHIEMRTVEYIDVGVHTRVPVFTYSTWIWGRMVLV